LSPVRAQRSTHDQARRTPRLYRDRRGILADPISGTAVLEYGATEILPPVGAILKHPARLCRPGRQATPHSRAESRGSRHSKAARGERQTLRWREQDSNHRSLPWGIALAAAGAGRGASAHPRLLCRGGHRAGALDARRDAVAAAWNAAEAHSMIVAICMAAPSRIRAAPGTAAKTRLANHNVGVGLQRAAERLRGHAQCCRMGCHADRNAPLSWRTSGACRRGDIPC
jgi:hypothetical protein